MHAYESPKLSEIKTVDHLLLILTAANYRAPKDELVTCTEPHWLWHELECIQRRGVSIWPRLVFDGEPTCDSVAFIANADEDGTISGWDVFEAFAGTTHRLTNPVELHVDEMETYLNELIKRWETQP